MPTTEHPVPTADEEETRRRARLARLEADLAYFQARLEILGVPGSANQVAQCKAFKLLHASISSLVIQSRRQAAGALGPSPSEGDAPRDRPPGRAIGAGDADG